MHGPSAVHDMLQTPAMPRGDGTYYQPGAFYTHGTPYLDSLGNPIFRFGGTHGMVLKEGFDLREWLAASREGEEALVALEAARQQKRLEQNGAAHCFKPSDVCPGGKRLENCDVGSTAYGAAEDWIAENAQERPGDGAASNVLAYAGGRCAECSVSCEVAVATLDGMPQETRVSFSRPDPNIPTIEIKGL